MKVLIIGLNFAPELIGVGKYSSEFAEWLSERDHEVRVITTPPYYPGWRVEAGYQACQYRRERCGDVDVLRCPLWVPRVPSTAKRIVHLLSFALSSFLPSLWQGLVWRPDVVWTVEPTAFTIPGALLAARLGRATACLHVQDLEIEAAFSLRMLSRSWLTNGLRRAYGWWLRRFDLVTTISEQMRDRLSAFGVSENRLGLFRNWVDVETIQPLKTKSPLRAELGFGDDQVVAMYAGNMGAKQGVEVLADVARQVVDNPKIQFVLSGAGAARDKLEVLVEDLPNITLLPLQPSERLNELLNVADMHLLPQRPEAESFALPSKLSGMLASGRPVIVQTDGGELARAAGECGVVVPPGDAAAMGAAVIALAKEPKRRRALARAARRFAEHNLARERILARYEQRLEQLVEGQFTPKSAMQRLVSALMLSRMTPALPPPSDLPPHGRH